MDGEGRRYGESKYKQRIGCNNVKRDGMKRPVDWELRGQVAGITEQGKESGASGMEDC